jgi:hypothetical protein
MDLGPLSKQGTEEKWVRAGNRALGVALASPVLIRTKGLRKSGSR